jgi:hypothetical protein
MPDLIATIGPRSLILDEDALVSLVEDGRVCMGPISITDAIDSATVVASGRSDHHSVTALVNMLALAVLALASDAEG